MQYISVSGLSGKPFLSPVLHKVKDSRVQGNNDFSRMAKETHSVFSFDAAARHQQLNRRGVGVRGTNFVGHQP
jgi:hypothetical protein